MALGEADIDIPRDVEPIVGNKAIEDAAIRFVVQQERLDRENRELRATVGQQQNQIQLLAARLTEQDAAIRKVNAQVELHKATAGMAANP